MKAIRFLYGRVFSVGGFACEQKSLFLEGNHLLEHEGVVNVLEQLVQFFVVHFQPVDFTLGRVHHGPFHIRISISARRPLFSHINLRFAGTAARIVTRRLANAFYWGRRLDTYRVLNRISVRTMRLTRQ